MNVVDKALNGLLVIEPRIFKDARGAFFESFNAAAFNNILGYSVEFIQDNHSTSLKNVVRGLHLQAPPFAQGKLVRVASGTVIDLAVDVRVGSPTFGEHYAVELSAKNNLMMWIPPGFAHGFSVLENETVFLYKCTNVYHKDSEMTLLFNDNELNIDWRVSNPVVSDKDIQGLPLSQFKSPFVYT